MYTIWHNPRCTKSRQTLQILQENNIQPDIREYLKDIPTAEEIKTICALLEKKPREITRMGEKECKEARITKESTDEEIITAMTKYPKLIERPIVIKNNTDARVGRPPESVLEII